MLGFQRITTRNQPLYGYPSIRHDEARHMIFECINEMEIDRQSKNKLADFALQKFSLVVPAVVSYGAGVVLVKVQANSVIYGLQMDPSQAQVIMQKPRAHSLSAAIGAQVTVGQAKTGNVFLRVAVPFVPGVPTFAQLIAQRRFQPGQFMFGFESGLPVFGPWSELKSTIIAGNSEMGKTSTARFLMAQLAMEGAQFVIVDPQANAGERALSSEIHGLSLIASVAVQENEWMNAIRYVGEIGKRRVQGDSDRTHVVLVIDEANTLFDNKEIMDELSEVLRQYVRGYAKVNIHAICIAHDWSAKSTGGDAALRSLFGARFIHQMTRDRAGMLIRPEYKEAIEQQQPGQAHLRLADGSVRKITIPKTMASDLLMVGGGGKTINHTLSWKEFLASNRKSEMGSEGKRGEARGSEDLQSLQNGQNGHFISVSIPATSPASVASPASAIVGSGYGEADIVAMFANGMGVKSIIAAIWGEEKAGGRGYAQYSDVVNSVLRKAIKGRL